MHLLIGLGNPGRSYAANRHNIGFMAVEAIARAYSFQAAGGKFFSQTFKGRIAGKDIFAILPQTFMNRSGAAVGEAARFYKIPAEKIIVIHDELDLETGRLKVKLGGGHGGHNGLKDIDDAIGQNYWRIRLGIGHPGRKEMVTGHVLSDFPADEWSLEEKLIDAVAKHFPLMLTGTAETFMNAVALEGKSSESRV